MILEIGDSGHFLDILFYLSAVLLHSAAVYTAAFPGITAAPTMTHTSYLHGHYSFLS